MKLNHQHEDAPLFVAAVCRHKEWGALEPMARLFEPKGWNKGNMIFYQHYCAEILNVREDELELCGVGWVKRSECRLEE